MADIVGVGYTCGHPEGGSYDYENRVEHCEDGCDGGVFISCEFVCSNDSDDPKWCNDEGYDREGDADLDI